MCLDEYDEAFHIASEKEISFQEGRLEERKNTEKERLRAEKEQLRAEKEQLRAEIFKQKLQGKSDAATAESLGISLEEVQNILSEI